MKKILCLFMLVCTMALTVGCTDGDYINVGNVGPLTGSLAVYGQSVKDAIEMAIEEINEAGGVSLKEDGEVVKKQLKLFSEDTEGKGDLAKLAYTRISGKIDFLIGEVTSGSSEVVATEATKDKMPMLTPTATALSVTANRPTVFRACFLDPDQGDAMANFAKTLLGTKEDKRVAVLFDNSDDYSSGIAAAFIAEANKIGLNVVEEDGGLRADATDFQTLVTKVTNSNPDVVFSPVYYETAAVLIKQFRAASFTKPFLGADGFDGILAVSGIVAADYNNVYFSNHYAADSTDQKVQTFVTNYKTKYGESPNALAALAYDSVYIMKAALEKAGTTEKAAVVTALASVEYQGVTGNVKFNASGNPSKDIQVVEYKDGVIKFKAIVPNANN